MSQPIDEIPTPEDIAAWVKPYIPRDGASLLIEDLNGLVVIAAIDHTGAIVVGLSSESTRRLIGALTRYAKAAEHFLSPEAQRQRLMEQRLAAARKRVETEGFER